MISLRLQRGYTIVEVMIFLAVSAALFASAVAAINIQNRRNQFNQSVIEFEQRLSDLLNDVETGYYPRGSNFTCQISGGRPQITPGTSQQGTNRDCIFIGRTIQFAPDELGPTGFNIYSIVGLRQGVNSAEAGNIEEAKPIALDGEAGTIIEQGILDSGVEIAKVFANPTGTSTNIETGGLAVLSGFGQTASSGAGLESGFIRVALAIVPSTKVNQPKDQFISAVQALTEESINQAASGFVICLQESGIGGRHATINVGTSGRLSVEKNIDVWPEECKTT